MKSFRTLPIGLAFQVGLFTAPLSAANTPALEPSVTYTVTVAQPHTHIFAVRMDVTGLSEAHLDVSMPVWTPGSYLVREYERHVVTFAAHGASGNALDWRKLDKNSWRIFTPEAGTLTIEYEVYAREPGIRWSFVYDEGGHVIGPSLFMYVVGHADRPTSVRFSLPESWGLVGGIAASNTDPYEIRARSYHELIDTPMLIGAFDSLSFEVEGVPHVIAILGSNNADLEALAEDFSKIIRVCSQLFGGLPYERYALIFTTLTGGGGIEHANGTTIGLGSLDFQSEHGQRAVRGVTAHEFFHAWNVKRIQPPAFRPYDYEQENYTDALWFYEGFTSYYGDRILYRAGLSESRDDPVGFVTGHRSTPGYRNQSAADASFNAWIHLYRGDESTENYRTDYYFKGNVIAHLLELEIAHRTAGAKGLDDVLRLMWQRTRDEGAAFDSEGIRAVAEEVVGGSLEEFFDRYVFGTADIPFEDFFARAGYRLTVDTEATERRDQVGYLGVRTREVDGRVRIVGTVRGAPAWRDGLNYGDDILAIGGVEVTDYDSFLTALRSYGPGASVEFRVARFGGERSIPVTLGVRIAPVYRLEEVEDPSDLQLAVRRRWRG